MSLDKNSLASPYLNFDPSILRPNGASQFIVPEGQTEHRGKMEMSFLKIGGSVCVGGFLGSLNGLAVGLRETSNLTGSVRRTQMINFVGKQGSRTSQLFGALALIYSLNDTIVSNVRGVDDQFNVIPAAGLTGAIYSSASGSLKTVAKSTTLGLGLSLAYLALTNKELLLGMVPSNQQKYY